MGNDFQPLSPVQAELLRQILNDGNQQVGPTLQMILAQAPENLQIKTSMAKFADLEELFGHDSLMSVKIGFEGDIKGSSCSCSLKPGTKACSGHCARCSKVTFMLLTTLRIICEVTGFAPTGLQEA